ncbi:MAG: HmuY family protein [Bradyrhizobiaceae bacterium]|nr:HmuY family protein [Bradyrhizobiaceae bacterium]
MIFSRTSSLLALVAICAVLLTGCPSTQTTPPETVATVRSNMQPDSTIGWMYYSLDADSVIPASQANSANWDIRMPYLLCCGQTKQVDVMLNSGTAGPGNTKGAMVSSRFENLTAVPEGTTLVTDDSLASNRIVPVAVIGSNVMFVYDMSSHTIRPSPDKCLIVQTNSGNKYKFQFTSIYQDNNPTPTFMTPLGYYHFRYQKLP